MADRKAEGLDVLALADDEIRLQRKPADEAVSKLDMTAGGHRLNKISRISGTRSKT